MSKLAWGLLLLSLSCGIWLRATSLDSVPLQSDESVNWYLARTLASGSFQYDPAQFHGPLFFRLLTFFDLDSERSLRSTSVITGSLLIALPFVLTPLLGIARCTIAALLLAFDPVLVYYSRVAIHESLYCLFSAMVLVFTLRWASRGGRANLYIVGASLGLLAATKETFAIPLIASVVALSLSYPGALKNIAFREILFTSIAAILFTMWGYERVDGPLEVLKGIIAWSYTGLGETSQVQPWWYFGALLLSISPLALLGLTQVMTRDKSAQYVAICGLLILSFYSVLPYKTPWLLCSVLFPLYLALAATPIPTRAVTGFACLQILLMLLVNNSTQLQANKTSEKARVLSLDILEHCERVGPHCRVFVGAQWYWPLPFYLRSIESQTLYSEKPLNLPLDDFHVVVLPGSEVPDIVGWTRRTVALSRLQTVTALFAKEEGLKTRNRSEKLH